MAGDLGGEANGVVAGPRGATEGDVATGVATLLDPDLDRRRKLFPWKSFSHVGIIRLRNTMFRPASELRNNMEHKRPRE